MSTAPTPDVSRPEASLALQLWALSDAFHRNLAAELQPMGLTVAGFRLIGELIAEPGGVRVGTLASRLGLRAPTVSGMIDRFAAQGLVERVPDADDGRAARVRLADRAPLAEGFAVLARLEQRLTAGADDDARAADLAGIARLLARLNGGT